MATDSPSSPTSSKASPSNKRAPSQTHEYTSLQDLREFPCTCPICTYVRQRRETGRRPEIGPPLADSIVTRVALAMLLPIPDPPRFRSKGPAPRGSPRGPRASAGATLEFLGRHVAAAISRAFGRLIGAVQATEDEEVSSPRGRLPFVTC